ncbi:hypothetical protein [Kangiella sp. TOML190]|uniref:hypothetical protein n=1 Tax=Kangiella sp. TOML190 TaxID=2931351 RepID=UPI00203FF611|nr:hypothetical protein [Kangiella sp. TOML190]
MSSLDNKSQPQAAFKLSPLAMILNILGMALIMFAAYEIYSIHETGAGFLTDIISWPYYPWVMIVLGIVLMIPFHKQIIQAYKLVKQQQREWQERNKPKF